VFAERRYEPFGERIDELVEPEGGGTPTVGAIDYTRELHNILNKPADPDTGWSYHGARWMGPDTARWLTPDPPVKAPDRSFMAEPWALHPYQYVGQNPISFWDPDGHGRVKTAIETAARLVDKAGKVAGRSMINMQFAGHRVSTAMLRKSTNVARKTLDAVDRKFPNLEVPYSDAGMVDFTKATHSGSGSVTRGTVNIGGFTERAADARAGWRQFAASEKLSKSQLDSIKSAYRMHHDYKNGVLVVVDKDVHDAYRHTGGNAWNKAGLYGSAIATGLFVGLFPNTAEAATSGEGGYAKSFLHDIGLNLFFIGEAQDAADLLRSGTDYAAETMYNWEDSEGEKFGDSLFRFFQFGGY
jgi:RHS repeat-associated protein